MTNIFVFKELRILHKSFFLKFHLPKSLRRNLLAISIICYTFASEISWNLYGTIVFTDKGKQNC